MFCTACGSRNNKDSNFCKHCGVPLEGQHKISEQAFERALPEDEQVAALLERAYCARKDGDRLGAITLCHEALSVRPKSTSCHSLLGQLYEQGGERDLAIEQYEQVLALNPGSIADRVKLDELRGDVPALAAGSRPHPHIVLADRSKNAPAFDIRVPTIVLAGVALMVLGGIFTMQMLSARNGSRSGVETNRTSNSQTNLPAGNAGQQSAGQQSANGTSIAATDPQSAYSPGIGLGTGTPIFIQTTPPRENVNYTPASRTAASPVSQNGVAPIGPPDGTETPDKRVHLVTNEDGAGTEHASTPVKTTDKIVVNQGGSSSPNPPPEVSGPGSDSKKFEAMADDMAVRGQYKQAGDQYIHAVNGAGDDTAYLYSRAAWCFQQAGEKATAVSYYRQGIEAAQKLAATGAQSEIARNLIRDCQTGIKVCSN